MEALAVSSVVLLAAVVVIHSRVCRELSRVRYLLTRHRPIQALLDHDGNGLPFPAQLLREVAGASRDARKPAAQIEELRSLLRYLHGYVWETMDRRTFARIEKGAWSY
jgi:hypothetical protein